MLCLLAVDLLCLTFQSKGKWDIKVKCYIILCILNHYQSVKYISFSLLTLVNFKSNETASFFVEPLHLIRFNPIIVRSFLEYSFVWINPIICCSFVWELICKIVHCPSIIVIMLFPFRPAKYMFISWLNSWYFFSIPHSDVEFVRTLKTNPSDVSLKIRGPG